MILGLRRGFILHMLLLPRANLLRRHWKHSIPVSLHLFNHSFCFIRLCLSLYLSLPAALTLTPAATQSLHIYLSLSPSLQEPCNEDSLWHSTHTNASSLSPSLSLCVYVHTYTIVDKPHNNVLYTQPLTQQSWGTYHRKRGEQIDPNGNTYKHTSLTSTCIIIIIIQINN